MLVNKMEYTKNKETFEPLIGIGITFLDKIHEFAQNDFGIEKNNLIEGFLKSEYATDYLSCIEPSHLHSLLN